MANEITFKIRIDGSDSVKEITLDSKELAQAFSQVQTEVKGLKANMVSLASTIGAIDGVANALSQLSGMMSGLTSAYAVQESAETRLAQAMRNSMGATDEQIQAIKDLTSQQQVLGVVGDEVQLTAAQELATYLELSSSLETIIPVMNDMIAQQLGLGASAEGATQIATMLGKVMNGQTEALSRYGYKFDEAQKQILQFGTESERAAVLAQVVSEAVGGMNAKLANTNSGQIQKLANSLGDAKEKAGSLLSSISPMITGLSELANTGLGILKIVAAFKELKDTAFFAKIESMALAVAHKTQAAAARILGVSEEAAAFATGKLKTQILLLQSAMTFGLALAIQAIISLIVRFTSKSNTASEAVKELDDATDAFKNTSSQMRSELSMEIVALEDLIKQKGKEGEKVEELNSKYGEAFGYHKTAAEWYDVLTTKSSEYCKMLGYEAKAKVLAAKSGDKQVELDSIEERMKRLEAAGQNQMTVTTVNQSITGTTYNVQETEYGKLSRKAEALRKEISGLDDEFRECMSSAAALASEVNGSANDAASSIDWQKMSLSDLSKKIQEQEALVKSLAGTEDKEAFAAQNNILKQMQARETSLKSMVGLPTSGGGTSSKSLSSDIESYRTSVERAVQVNQTFYSGKADILAQLDAMKSGITQLIGKYGAEIDTVKALIKEYNTLRDAMRGTLEPIPELDPIKTEAKTENNGGLAKRKEKIDLKVTGEEKVKRATSSLSALGDVMSSLSGAVGENAASWLTWISNLISAISAAIPAIASLVAAKKQETNANVEAAATGGASSVASIPYVGPIMAVAAVASILAAFASIPKFATGGIAYGPTLGLFGEYSGAANNPEVVAPLDRLRALIGTTDSGFSRVDFRIRGRDLVSINNRETSRRRRS
ncbi:MAG: hypothetical protein ACI3ZP_10165 [Candidatus Cryptobacteroides sp.]